MGCLQSQQHETKSQQLESNTKYNVRLQNLQIRKVFQNNLQKLKRQYQNKLNDYLKAVRQPLKNRNKDVQWLLLQQCVFIQHRQILAQRLLQLFKSLKDKSEELKSQQKVLFYKSKIDKIIFCQDILCDQLLLQKFCNFIRKKHPSYKFSEYPFYQDQVKDYQILIHLKKTRKPTKTMVKQFAYELCNNKNLNIKLQNLAQSGNNFSYST